MRDDDDDDDDDDVYVQISGMVVASSDGGGTARHTSGGTVTQLVTPDSQTHITSTSTCSCPTSHQQFALPTAHPFKQVIIYQRFHFQLYLGQFVPRFVCWLLCPSVSVCLCLPTQLSQLEGCRSVVRDMI